MSSVREADVVLHYANGAIRAVSEVTQRAEEAPRPLSLPEDVWDQQGWLLPVRMMNLARPVGLDDIPLNLRASNAQRMFDRNGAVVQGYLFPVDIDWFTQFVRIFRDRLPHDIAVNAVAPAEITGGAEALLRGLIGDELHTLTGSTNSITGVYRDQAIVATGRSPEGQPVPIAEVQLALDLLRDTGSVVCQPEVVGYRSAFIGAVLRTLPGTIVTLTPPTVSFGLQPAGGTFAAGTTRTASTSLPDGPLDTPATRNVRTEQPALRRALVGNRLFAGCDLCGEEMPVELLVAAHIKQRSMCNDDEKRDIPNVGMLACKLGCDDLYELGYISVDPAGTILTVTADETMQGRLLSKLIARLDGSPCRAFTAANARYFEWHRNNKFRGMDKR